MRNFTLIILANICSLTIVAQPEKEVSSKITNVTVYQEGAEILRQSKVALDAGKTTLIYKGLSAKIDNNSVQAKGDNGMTILSVSQSIDYLNEAEASERILKLANERLTLRDSIALIEAVKKVYMQEKEMILANKSIGGDNGVDVNELRNAATFFRERLTEIEQKLKQLNKDKYNINLKIIQLSKQLNEWNAKSTLPTSIIKLVVSAKQKTTSNVELKYIVGEAGWTPNYDLRIDEVDQPLGLSYKAKVFQNSGEDWKNVKLILSTGNPSLSNYKPELSTYYLAFNNFYRPPSPTNYEYQQPVRGMVRGRVTDAESGEAIPGVNVIVKGTTLGAVSNIDGNYEINMPTGKSTLVFSFIGYTQQEIVANSGITNVALYPDIEQLSEVVVTGYAKPKLRIRGVESISEADIIENIPLAVEKRQTSTEFEIEIPYTIPSDNQSYDVTMVEYRIPVEYNYSAVPKISEDAYLTAKIADWTQYEMVSGSANIFFQGIYQGETFLDLDVFEDTLNISVGRDQDIVISREIQKDFSKKNLLGSTVKETKSWEITIKNNKNTSIDLILEDQFPISKDSDIKVTQLESSGADFNEDDGKLIWELKLAPKDKKTLILQYEVRYPKNRNLIVE